jgi:hypothetical protein
MSRLNGKFLFVFAGAAVLFVVAVSPAMACHDRTDKTVVQLRQADLTTEQLKAIFEYQKEHKDLITKSHQEGLGCSVHENHQAVFEKAAFGVLKDEQFKKVVGRERTEAEALRYENYLLKQEVTRLKAEIEAKAKAAAEPSKN